MSHAPSGIVAVLLLERYRLSICFLLIVCCPIGCSRGPATTDVTVFLREHHDELKIPMTVESVEITATEQIGDPPETRVTFSGRSRANEDLYVLVSLEEAFQSLGYDAAEFQTSLLQFNALRAPEKSAVTRLMPTDRPTAAIYRRIHSVNDVVEYFGTGTAVLEERGWKLRKLAVTLPDTWKQKNVVGSSTLGSGVIRIDLAETRNGVTELIAQQKQFVSAVSQSLRKIESRLANEQAQLIKATQPGSSWVTTFNGTSGRPEKVRATFVGKTFDNESLVVLLMNVDDPTQRSVWTGSVLLVPVKAEGNSGTAATRSRHDGWVVAMKPVEPTAVYPMAGYSSDLMIAPTAAGLVTWLDRSEPQSLSADSDAPPVPDVSSMAETVQRLTTPGTVLEGLFHSPPQKSDRMRMTVTENRDNGQYVRAVLESLDDPSLAVTFEGTAGTQLESLYGQPIRLTRQLQNGCASNHPLFTTASGRQNIAELSFVLIGHDPVRLHAAGLELQPATPLANFESNKTQWEAALQPGTRWSGKLLFGDSPQQKITLTVAESRDELSYLRVLVEDNDVRTRCRVLEGSLNRSDALVDSYALSLSGSRPATQPRARRSAWGGELFGVHPDQHLFRLSADGNTIIGRTDSGEQILLTRDEQKSSVPLEKELAAAYWREKIVKGARWRGSLYNSKADQKTDVELEITSDVDETGNVAGSIKIPKGPKGRIDFKGVLRLQDPQNSNAFALNLEKLSPGIDSPSPVFGRTTNIHVNFRFGTADASLLGYAGTGDSPYEEVLDLVRVVPAAGQSHPLNSKPPKDE